jgi:putative transcriptional regulator
MTNELRVLRARHGLSQAELAEKLGVSRQTINAIETGRYDPSLPLAFKIAALFGHRIEEIFSVEDGARKLEGRLERRAG